MRVKVPAKKPAEIALSRAAGKLAAEVLSMIAPHVKPGVSTDELDRLCHDYIVNVQKAIPANVGYHGFPKTLYTSVNHVVCHGIPSDKKLRDGDIINIDIAVLKDGWFTEPTILENCDVDIDDIAIQKLFIRWNSVAHHMIDRGVQGFRETVISDIGWNGLLHVDYVVMAQPIKLIGRNTWLDMRRDHAQNLRSQFASSP